MLDPQVSSARSTTGGARGAAILQRYQDLRDIIAILGIEELSTRTSWWSRARKIQRFLSQPFFVAEQFTGTPGKFVSREDTVRGFKEILEGKHDALPEQAFYMVGSIEYQAGCRSDQAPGWHRGVDFVASGLLEVQPGLITVLADTAIRGHDLDEAKALESRKAAQEAMANRASTMDYGRAQAELAEAAAQLAAIDRLRKRRH
jgi:hypothetical protein